MPLRRRSRARLVALVAVVGTLGACARGGPAAEAPDGPARGSIRAVNAARASLLPVWADALPSFSLDRYHELLAQLHGTPVVVNMWGSWCPPCKAEAPMLARAHDAYGDRVQFVGIDIEDSVASARAFVRTYGWTFPSVRDPAFPSAFRRGLGFAGQPNTLFYDASGRLVSSWQGPLTRDALASGLRTIAGGGSGA